MALKIGINGFGRIGRLVFRAADKLDVWIVQRPTPDLSPLGRDVSCEGWSGSGGLTPNLGELSRLSDIDMTAKRISGWDALTALSVWSVRGPDLFANLCSPENRGFVTQ